MPSTITSICNAISSLAELIVKPAPQHALNGVKMWLFKLGLRQLIRFASIDVTMPLLGRAGVAKP